MAVKGQRNKDTLYSCHMNTRLIVVVVVIVLLLGGGGYGMSTYNSLIKTREASTAQWAQVESQYQRRFDLIPNLVEAVKGAMKQEQAVFSEIADARTRYAGAKGQGIAAESAAATQLDSAVSRLLVVMEQYPQLRSIDTVTTLMSQLEGTENRIAVERMRFNESVQSYNVALQVFPSSLVGRLGGFQPIAYTQAPVEAQTSPKVSL